MSYVGLFLIAFGSTILGSICYRRAYKMGYDRAMFEIEQVDDEAYMDMFRGYRDLGFVTGREEAGDIRRRLSINRHN